MIHYIFVGIMIYIFVYILSLLMTKYPINIIRVSNTCICIHSSDKLEKCESCNMVFFIENHNIIPLCNINNKKLFIPKGVKINRLSHPCSHCNYKTKMGFVIIIMILLIIIYNM